MQINGKEIFEKGALMCFKSWIEVRELALKTLHIFGYKPDNFNYD